MMIATLFGKILASRWALRVATAGRLIAAILLFLLNLRRAGERTGVTTERLKAMERTNAIQRRMLEAAADRPRNRADLVDRLRDGRF